MAVMIPAPAVQCLVALDCAGGLVCDPDTKSCVECTPAAAGACQATLGGSRCLAGGQCGCTQDGDCGSVTSGRVCDGSIGRCVPGCHGAGSSAGANGCPVSEVCSSTTSAVGACQPPPALDGGAAPDGAGADTPGSGMTDRSPTGPPSTGRPETGRSRRTGRAPTAGAPAGATATPSTA